MPSSDDPSTDPLHSDGAPRPKKKKKKKKKGDRAAGRSTGKPVSKADKILRVERRTTTVAGEGEMVMLPSLAAPAWEFIHPRCARRRREDLEEVEAMIEAGEPDVA